MNAQTESDLLLWTWQSRHPGKLEEKKTVLCILLEITWTLQVSQKFISSFLVEILSWYEKWSF